MCFCIFLPSTMDAVRTRTYESLKSLLFIYVVVKYALKSHRHLRARGVVASASDLYTWIAQQVIFLALRLPSAKAKVALEMEKAKLDVEDRLVPKGPNVTRHLALPSEGQSLEWILAEMDTMDNEMSHLSSWRQGKISGAVYHGGEDLERVIVSNPLHPDVFPAVRKMEAEIVAQTLQLYNNPDGAGTMTSGGTESIIMSVKTHRDWARAVKGITEPEMIGAAYLKIKVHTVPVDPYTRKVDIKAVKRAINPNTIMLVGSTVNFPDGNQDDIEALGKLAAKYKLGLHVDSCLGSFIIPYLEKAGLSNGSNGKYKLHPCDFRVPGVTAVSCDTHKYGFSPKGTSVIMYRDAELRRYQYYVYPDWTGGVYASPSLSGSRPGALIAGTWAAMQYMGSNGYLESCRSIVTCARTIADRIVSSVPELYILGSPPASVIAFGSKHPKVNVLEVGDKMSKRGWHLNALTGPAALHIACTAKRKEFIADLKDSIREAKLEPSGQGSMVRLYGVGKSTAVGPQMVTRLATMFLDTMYKA
ncbi:pyridoxal phosphate-dependent transferase [Mycena amicta]|nr:pyridoxal phosphate-dependent transferase [Mycena amicta]